MQSQVGRQGSDRWGSDAGTGRHCSVRKAGKSVPSREAIYEGLASQGRQSRVSEACQGQADVGGQAREAGMKESRPAPRHGREVNLGHVRRQGRHASK